MHGQRRTIASFAALGAGLTLVGAPLAAAAAPTSPHTYQHGRYAQAHFTSQGTCQTAENSTKAAVNRAGGISVSAGACHPIDILTGTTKHSGYMYDLTYVASAPVWTSDRDLGSAPAASVGAHSFRDTYSATTSTVATWHFTNDTAAAKAKPGGAVTYSTGVKKNAATGRYEYEIDYDSRTPTYANHVEISENAGVTSPKIGVTNPIPTKPTNTAGNSGVTKPGDGTMGWHNGTAGSPPVATAPSGPVTTGGSTSNPSGTVTSTGTGAKLGVQGIDISAHTSINDWSGWKSSGVKFLYTKASEGNYYTNPKFANQYSGAYANGIVRGAYHFANPAVSTGADQADYFIAHGGGWSPDGRTLPGALDMEWNPYGDMCFGLSQAQMNTWVRSFLTEYKLKTGAMPAIYTAKIWWNKCVGTPNYTDVPLWVAQYNSSLTALPAGWTGSSQLIWQNAALDSKGYDTNIFNGTLAQLMSYALTGRRS